ETLAKMITDLANVVTQTLNPPNHASHAVRFGVQNVRNRPHRVLDVRGRSNAQTVLKALPEPASKVVDCVECRADLVLDRLDYSVEDTPNCARQPVDNIDNAISDIPAHLLSLVPGVSELVPNVVVQGGKEGSNSRRQVADEADEPIHHSLTIGLRSIPSITKPADNSRDHVAEEGSSPTRQ